MHFLCEEKEQKTKVLEFKISVILDMWEQHLGYCENARNYKIGANPDICKNRIKCWEHIYLEEGLPNNGIVVSLQCIYYKVIKAIKSIYQDCCVV